MTQGRDTSEQECVFTRVDYTDTSLTAPYDDLVAAAKWLETAIEADNAEQASRGMPSTRLENPLGGLVRDERRQSVQPEGREAMLALMERIAAGAGEPPERVQEPQATRVRRVIGTIAKQISVDHEARAHDHILYELN